MSPSSSNNASRLVKSKPCFCVSGWCCTATHSRTCAATGQQFRDVCVSAAHSQTHATGVSCSVSCAPHLFSRRCSCFLWFKFLRGATVSQVSIASLQYVAPRRYLTTLVTFEAVGKCLITLSVGFSRTPVLPGARPPSREVASQTGRQPVSVAHVSAANWSSTESTDLAVQRQECEVDPARGDAPVRNLCSLGPLVGLGWNTP